MRDPDKVTKRLQNLALAVTIVAILVGFYFHY